MFNIPSSMNVFKEGNTLNNIKKPHYLEQINRSREPSMPKSGDVSVTNSHKLLNVY